MKREYEIIGTASGSKRVLINRSLIEARSLPLAVPIISYSLLILGLLSACTTGPKYRRPTVQAPGSYKELIPENFKGTDGWKVAQPKDDQIRNNWWEMFDDPNLNALEEQVDISNQTIAAAAANYEVARALVKQARSQYFPLVTTAPSYTRSRLSATGRSIDVSTGVTTTNLSLPFDVSWEPDLWGRIRNTVKENAYEAQATAADLENTRLSVHAQVATVYYQLRGQDALRQLLDETVIAFQESLDLTKVLYETGIASDQDVAQAETQLQTTQAQATDLGILRAQYEHAIALLIGQPASTFSIPVEPLKASPPAIPFGFPSELLERRPDIAAAERRVAEANAGIGVAKAAYFPALLLNSSTGFQSSSITQWLTWPSRIWSVGPSLAQTLFDAGERKAVSQQARANYDLTVANYRETVLTAFQEVEDSLAALRILSQERQQQDAAVNSSERFLRLAIDRYKLGIDSYLNVITAQTTLLNNQQAAVNIRMQQMTASVQLIMALGGSWNAAMLPSHHELTK
jgi:NodT family efflux transporter outer membrane factor (OMF) lipoprotein